MSFTLRAEGSGAIADGIGEISMSGGALTIGRGDTNDLVLPDPDRHISKNHCVVEQRGDDYFLIDHSSNGTFLNQGGAPIGRGNAMPLNNGDMITMGRYEFRVEIVDAAPTGGFDPLDDLPAPAEATSIAAPVQSGHSYDRNDALDDGLMGADDDLMGLLEGETSRGESVRNQGFGPRDGLGEDPLGDGPLFDDDAADPLAVEAGKDPLGLDDDLGLAPEAASVPDHTSDLVGHFSAPKPAIEDDFDPLADDPGLAPEEAAPPPSQAPAASASPELDPLADDPLGESLSPDLGGPNLGSAESDPYADLPPPAPEPAAPQTLAPSPAPAAPQDDTAQGFPPPARPAGRERRIDRGDGGNGSGGAARVQERPAASTPASSPPRPPVPSPSPAAPPARPAAPGTGGADAATLAFLQAAGADVSKLSPDEMVATMASLGGAFRTMVAGLREVLMTRTSIKDEFRMKQTQMSAEQNNPLKWSPSPEFALEMMMRPARGYMAADQAVDQALKDIRAHEIATISGMEAAVKAILKRLDPAELAGRLESGSSLGAILGGKKARYWEIYEKMYAEIASDAEDDFQKLFGQEFARAYEEQLRKL